MRAEDRSIRSRQFGASRHAYDHHPIREDRGLLRLVGQRVYPPEPDEYRTQRNQQEYPSPASESDGLLRLVRHSPANGVTPWRMPDAGCVRSRRNSLWH